MSLEVFRSQVEGVVGPDNVITASDLLERYSKDMSFVTPRKPFFAVKVHSADQVQAIIKLANAAKVPLIPFSCGWNGQGAHIPLVSGVVVDLSEMKNAEIDEICRNAIIEPGVTFRELAELAKQYGLRPLYPVTLPADASALVTNLERCPLYSWYRYGSNLNLLTFEIVLPTGELIGTGQWAIFNRVHKQSASPDTMCYGVSRMFLGAQGTLGIAVKGAIVLKNIHEENRVVFLAFDKLERVIEAFRCIAKVDVGEEVFAVNALRFAAQFSGRAGDEIKELAKSLPPWILVVVLRGSREEVEEVQLPDLKDALRTIDAELKDDVEGLPGSADLVLKELAMPEGIRNLAKYKGAYNFIPVMAVPSDVPSLDAIVSQLSEKAGVLDVAKFVMPADWAARAVYFEAGYFRDPQDKGETERVKSLFYTTSEQLFMAGAFFDRPYGAWATMVFNRAGTYHRVLKKIKSVVDPNGIMNPGKLMLWG